MAFTTRDARLVIAYSSVAQMGFILLGIFSLQPQGGQGALLQMLNHGIVTAASFFVVAAVAARAGGSESLDDMGGVAFRAPVLATLFLIVTFANLAMPGSSNFIGEFMILLGTFDSHMAIALIASVAVVGAAFYALRLFITRDAQPRRRPRALVRGAAQRGDRDRAAVPDHPGARLLPAVRAEQVREHDEGRDVPGRGGGQQRSLRAARGHDRLGPLGPPTAQRGRLLAGAAKSSTHQTRHKAIHS